MPLERKPLDRSLVKPSPQKKRSEGPVMHYVSPPEAAASMPSAPAAAPDDAPKPVDPSSSSSPSNDPTSTSGNNSLPPPTSSPATPSLRPQIPVEIGGVPLSLRLQYVLECERQQLHVNRSLALLLPKRITDPHLLVKVLAMLKTNDPNASSSSSSSSSSKTTTTTTITSLAVSPARINNANGITTATVSHSPPRLPTESQWRQYYSLPDGVASPSAINNGVSRMRNAQADGTSTTISNINSNNNNNNNSPNAVRAAVSAGELSDNVRATSMFGASSPQSPLRRQQQQQQQQQAQEEQDEQQALTEIDCSLNVLGDKGLLALVPVLGRLSCSLRRLSFRRCGLGDKSVAVLLEEVLPMLPLLDELDLSENVSISHEGGGKVLHRYVLAKLAARDREREKEERRQRRAEARVSVGPTAAEEETAAGAEDSTSSAAPAAAIDFSNTAIETTAAAAVTSDHLPIATLQAADSNADGAAADADVEPTTKMAAEDATAPLFVEPCTPTAASVSAASPVPLLSLPSPSPSPSSSSPLRPRFFVSHTSINAALAKRIEQPALNQAQHFALIAVDHFGDVVCEARTKQLSAGEGKSRSAIDADEDRERATMFATYKETSGVVKEVTMVKAAAEAKSWWAEEIANIAQERQANAEQRRKFEEEEARRKADEEKKCVLQ